MIGINSKMVKLVYLFSFFVVKKLGSIKIFYFFFKMVGLVISIEMGNGVNVVMIFY